MDADIIQRILYITPKVHVYAVPPLASNKGYTAAEWTRQQPIFTARLRIVETATHFPSQQKQQSSISTSINLEDPSSGELFAGAPYTHPSTVQPCHDSSRFFALRVEDATTKRKATLGIGFEERSEAFDFGISVKDAGKILGFTEDEGATKGKAAGMNTAMGQETEDKKDYSLKEGEMITVDISNHSRKDRNAASEGQTPATSEDMSSISLMPPPEPGGPLLPPPPSAASVKKELRKSQELRRSRDLQDLGFDDGEFGEFQ